MTNEKKARLGRGLDALFGELGGGTAVAEVPVEQIEENPYQPRKQFDDDELASLCASIRSHGVLQPLVVRQVGERFQLVAGERRLRAARTAGLPAVPVRVVDFNDQQTVEAALVENIQRADLNPIEKALGFKDYLDRFQMTHEQLAERLGMARPTITNLIALLELPKQIQDAVRTGQVTFGHAKLLKGITDPDRQLAVCKEIIARALSVHATEALLREATADADANGATTGAGRPAVKKTNHVQKLQEELRQKLGLRVEIRLKAKDRGHVVLPFGSNAEFEKLIEVLQK